MKMKLINQFKANFYELWYESYNRRIIKSMIRTSLVLSLVVFFAINDLIFVTYGSTKISFFIITIALLWIGIFNSIDYVCSIKPKLKVQNIQGMSMISFVIAYILFQLIICIIQTLLFFSIYFFWSILFSNNFPQNGIMCNIYIEYMIVIFLIIFSADILGFLVSSFAEDTTMAMKIMPAVLVFEMIFSNSLFELPKAFYNIAGWISTLTISRWGIDAFGSISNVEIMLDYSKDVYPGILFTHTFHHFEVCCLAIIIISIIAIVISCFLLNSLRKKAIF